MSALWLPSSTWQPMRKLRPSARARRSDQSALATEPRSHAGAPRNRAFLHRSAQTPEAATGMGKAENILASQRLPLHDQFPRRWLAAARDYARSDLGRAAARAGRSRL